MSESSAPLNKCPQCGTSLPSDATAGLCPRCILAQATQPPPAAAEDLTGLDVTVRVAAPVSTGTGRQEVELPLPEELTNLLPHGNYSVESFLGQGGMGAVYKGTQVRLKRPVAIKIMRRAMGKDYDFEQRFEREAQAMAKLNHPNIVSVIDYGEAGPDYLYIVMELVVGADMMDVIRGGLMTQEMALSLLPQICDALQFAHDHGIVHRDIKPSNIMLTKDGRIKMADFGLAKRFDAESSFRTQTGTGMGTPDYAAPEQFDPTSSIDHRADIYALGVMIYQMITGQLPRGVWKPPSQRAEVAPQWDAIVSRAMQSDPSDRYQQASEVKTDVTSIPLHQGRTAGPSAAASTPAPATSPNIALEGPEGSPRPKSRIALIIGIMGAAAVIVIGTIFALKKPEENSSHVEYKAMNAMPPAIPAEAWERKWNTLQEHDAKSPLTVVDGWVVRKIGSEQGTRAMPIQCRDGAIRAECRWATGAHHGSLQLRITSDKGLDRKMYVLSRAPKAIRLAYSDKDGENDELLKEHPADEPKEGDIYTLELRVVGRTLIAKLDGKEIIRVDDDKLRSAGRPGIDVSEKAGMKNIEALNLDPPAAPPPTSSLSEIQSFAGHRYQFAPGDMSWAQAKARAEAMGAHLATLTSREEANWIYLNFHAHLGGASNRGILIGGFTLDRDQPWQWVTGERMNFTDWGEGGPDYTNNTGKVTKGPFVMDFKQTEEKIHWSGTPESWSASNGFIFEWDDLGIVPPPSSPPVSAPSSAAWQPLFTDTEWRAINENYEFKDGRMRLIKNARMKSQPAPDAAIRARIQYQTGGYSKLALRQTQRGSYSASLTKGGRVVSLESYKASPLGRYEFPKPLEDGDVVKLELQARGTELRVLVNDAVVIEARDDRLTDAGTWGITGIGNWFESCEVQSLPAGIVSTSPNIPVSKPSTQQLPPGQWVKLFTKAGDLPAELRKPDSGVKWEDGWIQRSRKDVPLPLPSDLMGNYGVRLRFMRNIAVNTENVGSAGISVRVQSDGKGGYVALLPSYDSSIINRRVNGADTRLSKTNCPVPKIGEEGTLEFSVIGQLLISRLNSAFVTKATDSVWQRGSGRIGGTEPIRDIEVINLDGLPEAEALRILGVDEKGNDLRGKTGVSAAASPSPSPAWVPHVFATMDLKNRDHAEMQAPYLHIFGDDGWSAPSHTTSRDVAIRTTLVWDEQLRNVKLMTRDAPSPHYVATLHPKFVTLGVYQGRDRILKTFPITPTWQKGDDVEFRFATVGSQLAVWLNGQLLGQVTDATITGPGEARLQSGEGRFKNVDILNLDGLPQAEALRLLGLDDKGNDLRGKTAALSSPSLPNSPSPPVSIPGLPDLPPLAIPPAEPGLVKELEIKGGYLKRFMVLPDDRRLLAFPDGSVTMIDLESGKPLWTAAADATISSALNQDGSRFATYDLLDASGKRLGAHQGARQAKVTLRQSSDGRIIQTWMMPTTDKDSNYGFVALSPSGKTVMARARGEGADTSTFVCFEEGKSEPVDRWVPPQHLGYATHAWREDAFISSGSGGGGAVLMKRGGQIEPLAPEMAQYYSSISPDGNWLAASENGKLGLWDLRTRTFIRRFADSNTSTRDISFAGSDLVIMGHSIERIRTKTFKVWDRSTGKLLAVLPLTRPDEYLEEVSGAPNGTFAVIRVKHDPPPPGGEPNLLQIWRLPKPGQVHSSAATMPGGANAPSPSPRGGAAPSTVALEAGAIRLWDTAEKIPLGTGISWEDGALRVDKAPAGYTTLAAHGAIVRASVRASATTEGFQLNLRSGTGAEPENRNYYTLNVDLVRGDVLLKYLDGFKNSRDLQRWKVLPSYRRNEWVKMELLVSDGKLTASMDGKLLGTVRDSTLVDFTGFTLWATPHAHFRDIVYAPLGDVAVPHASVGASTSAPPSSATKAAPFVNTLGMKFVPVPITGGPTDPQRVLFSIWETRVQDYAVFEKETKRGSSKPDFEQGPTHPMINVSWDDATAFCTWLTQHERSLNKLGPDEAYRLPTDHEWSCAVGIGDREDASKAPLEKDAKIADVFPWGPLWPPTSGVGNYAGEELQPDLANGRFPRIQSFIKGYRDSYEGTASVGAFPLNHAGIYDLGGNVREWCGDWLDGKKDGRVLRGASWSHADQRSLLSSARTRGSPVHRDPSYGFRAVLAKVVETK